MTVKIYNTLSGKIEPLSPIKKGKINLFVCGPTVYDYSHIGHARTYVAFDMFANYLKHLGFDVFYLQNITDIDDKIIKRAKEKNISPKKLAKQFEKEHMADLQSLQVKSVKKYARATDYIKEIISQVERLLQKGFAYQSTDGIYYDVSKFKEYGKLSNRDGQIAEASFSRIDESVEKKNKADFCLWKFSKADEPSWPSPYGKGRPGWHIEDTAITEKYFGSQYDIHGGARDLIFPHHEAEISQMEAISGKAPLVKYWMHTGFLTINGQKMSKSLGNFTTIRDFLKETSLQALRMFIFSSHYRSPIDLKDSSITEAKANIEKLQDLIYSLEKIEGAPLLRGSKERSSFENLQEKFWQALEDDFNTPKAKASLFELIALANEKIAKNVLTKSQAKRILEFLKQINEIFLFLDFKQTKPKNEKVPEEIKKLAEQRENFRQAKEWEKADELRKQIEKLGYEIEDTEQGAKLKKN